MKQLKREIIRETFNALDDSHQIQLKNGTSQEEHAANHLAQNDWTVDFGRFDEKTGKMKFFMTRR